MKPTTYDDWTPADWDVEALAGELRDHGFDQDRVEFRTADGRVLQIASMASIDRRLTITLRDVP